MGIEIDFLPVGDNTKSGDAIVIRFGNPDNYKIMVVDGGTKDSGEEIVKHIDKYYETDYVDYVVNTHPDGDHASGLTVVLENLNVGELWMHLPWGHSTKIKQLFNDGRITSNSLEDRIRDSLNIAAQLYDIALEKRVPVFEPFAGNDIGIFKVLSPEQDWYINELLPEFPNMPDLKKRSGFGESIQKAKSGIINWIEERWNKETLSEDYEGTSFRNESSIVLYGQIEDHEVLLTADAGKKALNRSISYAASLNIDLKNCDFIQMPHHGSRRNVSPSVLDNLLGSTVSESSETNTTVFVSVANKSGENPKKKVVNAFIRRGARVYENRGKTIRHHYNMPDRAGWTPITRLQFNTKVEE